jgi:hypothetical protein
LNKRINECFSEVLMNLVDDIHNWKKWWSLRWIIITTFLSAVPVTYATLPDDWLPSIPDGVKAGLAFATMISAGMAAVSRVVKQKDIQE